ncbi:MAG: hypothetical protein ACRBCL_04105 [Maritimibacter sp.]
MRRTFIRVGGGALVLVLALGAFAAVRSWVAQPKGVLASELLSCSTKDYAAYSKIMPEAGEMGLPFSPDSGSPSVQRELLKAYDALNLSGPQTVVVTAHLPRRALFTQVCAEEKCTMDEQGRPMQVCLMETYNDCVYLATRFRGQEYCLLQPAEDE